MQKNFLVRRHVAIGLVRALIITGLLPDPASALIAGQAPDRPAARVDPNTATSPWRGVVAVAGPVGTTSGVAVGRRHILTAGHVAAPTGTFTITFNLGTAPMTRTVVKVTQHPAYGGLGVNDLGMLELDADLPAGAIFYPLAAQIPPAATPSSCGSTVTLVGYGDSGYGDTGNLGAFPAAATVKRVGTNAVDSYATDAQTGQTTVFYMDFDGPTAATNYLGCRSLGNATETTLASGDSGAPVFIQEQGTTKVFGVSAFTGIFTGGPTAPSSFGTFSGGQVVPNYAAWITSVIAASGYAGPLHNGVDVPIFGWLGAWPLSGALLGLALGARRPRRT